MVKLISAQEARVLSNSKASDFNLNRLIQIANDVITSAAKTEHRSVIIGVSAFDDTTVSKFVKDAMESGYLVNFHQEDENDLVIRW